MKGAQALEKTLDPMVTQALDRGGLQRDLLLGLGQGAQANVIKPKGGNWVTRPQDMLMKTAGSKLARILFPGATLGLYCPEEMGDRTMEDLESGSRAA